MAVPRLFCLTIIRQTRRRRHRTHASRNPGRVPRTIRNISLYPRRNINKGVRGFGSHRFARFMNYTRTRTKRGGSGRRRFTFLSMTTPRRGLLNRGDQCRTLNGIPRPIRMVTLPAGLLFPLVRRQVLKMDMIHTMRRRRNVRGDRRVSRDTRARLPMDRSRRWCWRSY